MSATSRMYGGVSAEDRQAARRSALIEAALDLFAEGGVQAVSKRAVCKRAGLNDRYFYESFTDTDALLEAIASEQLARLLEMLGTAAVQPDGLHAQTKAIAGVALEFLAEDPRRGALLLGSRGDDVLQTARVNSARAIAETLAAMSADEEGDADTSDLDRQVAAYALVSGTMQVIEAWLRGEIETSREHFAELVACLLAATPAITATLPRSAKRS